MKSKLQLVLVIALALLAFTAVAQASTVEVWTYYTQGPEREAFEWMLGQFNAAHDDIQLKARFIPSPELPNEVAKAYMMGNPPDIVVGGPRIGRYMVEGYADLTPFINESSVINQNDYFPGSWKECQYNHKVFGISHDSNTIILFWNKDLYRQAGLDPQQPPTNWDELISYARAINSLSDRIFGFSYTAPKTEEGPWQWLPFMWQNGGNLGELDGEAAVEALQLWVDMYEEGIVPPDVLTFRQSDQMGQFAAQNIGMVIDGPWDFWQLEDVEFEWGLTLLPKQKEHASALGGENMYVFDGPNVAAAFKVLEWTQRDDFLGEWMTRAQRIPSKVSVAGSNQWGFHDDYRFRVVAEQLKYARPRFYPMWPNFSIPIQIAIHKALTGQATARQALEEAAREVAPYLDDYRKW